MSAEERELIGRLLDAARNDVAPDEAERRARICESVLAGGPGGGGSEGPVSGVRLLRSWVGVSALGLGALAVLGAGAFALSASKTGDARSASDLPSTSAVSSASAVVEVPSAPSDETAVVPSLGTSVWELPSAVPASKKAVATPGAETDDLAVELAALESARKKLRDRDPASAMKLLDDFDRRFPHPRVGDEATVLRVEVLFALGRSEDARRLGREFVARHPDSIYRARIAQLLGEASP